MNLRLLPVLSVVILCFSPNTKVEAAISTNQTHNAKPNEVADADIFSDAADWIKEKIQQKMCEYTLQSSLACKQVPETIEEMQGLANEVGLDMTCSYVKKVFPQSTLLVEFGCLSTETVGAAWNEQRKNNITFLGDLPKTDTNIEKYSANWWNVVNTGQSACSIYLRTMGTNVSPSQTYITISEFSDSNYNSFGCSWGDNTYTDVPKSTACQVRANDFINTTYNGLGSNEFYPELSGCFRNLNEKVAY
jgi:hypothetical protein